MNLAVLDFEHAVYRQIEPLAIAQLEVIDPFGKDEIILRRDPHRFERQHLERIEKRLEYREDSGAARDRRHRNVVINRIVVETTHDRLEIAPFP